MNFTAYIFLAAAASPTELLLKPTPGLYIWTIITFLLLFFVLRKFAWKPLLNALNEREDFISNSLKDAEKAREELENINQESQDIITNARSEAQSILADGKSAAENIKQQTISDAKDQSAKIIEDAKKQIEAEKEKAMSEIKDEIVNISLNVAQKLISKNLSSEDNKKLIKDSLDQVGNYEA